MMRVGMSAFLFYALMGWGLPSICHAHEIASFESVYRNYQDYLQDFALEKFLIDPIDYKIMASEGDAAWYEPVPLSTQPPLTYQFLPSTTGVKRKVRVSMRSGSVYQYSWISCLNYSYSHEKAGHLHGGPGLLGPLPPPLDLQTDIPGFDEDGSLCVDMTQDTELNWTLTLPEFSAEINFLMISSGDIMSYKRFRIYLKVPDLMPLPDSDLYSSTGATKAHPFNYYARQDVIDKLKLIAKEYHDEFPLSPVLVFNDMSLPWGGLFDIGEEVLCPEGLPCQFWQTPHKSHRDGYNVDLRTRELEDDQLKRIRAIAESHGATVLNEGTHFHLNFRSKNSKDYEEYNVCY